MGLTPLHLEDMQQVETGNPTQREEKYCLCVSFLFGPAISGEFSYGWGDRYLYPLSYKSERLEEAKGQEKTLTSLVYSC